MKKERLEEETRYISVDEIKLYERKRLLTNFISLSIFIGAMIAVFFIIFGIELVNGNDMYPAVRDGDLALTYHFYDYEKNDVVFYDTDEGVMVGRIVAVAGDTIKISDGKLQVNGTVQTSNVIYPTYDVNGDWETSKKIPDGFCYILGDLREQSRDSRDLGYISFDSIRSKAIVIIRSQGI